jgi:hypothetical protein
MKKCSRCKINKSVSEFVKHKNIKSGYTSDCKVCRRAIGKIYYAKNKLDVNKKHNNYYQENKELILIRNKKNHKDKKFKFPWRYTLKLIKGRCNNTHNIRYKNYGGRGIKCLITEKELKELWFRDKAFEMIKPTIDRKDTDGNYCLENCRYIELLENISRPKSMTKYHKAILRVLPLMPKIFNGNELWLQIQESCGEFDKNLNKKRFKISDVTLYKYLNLYCNSLGNGQWECKNGIK